MRILLTGGLGFIGSHCAVVLSNNNHEVIIFDNLYNSKIEVLEKIKKISLYQKNIHFFKGDITIKSSLIEVFTTFPMIDSVIHFASLKSVNESINQPLLYYKKNINGLIHLLEVMDLYECKRLLFSSSATVYGSLLESPLEESMTTGIAITNPYGQTKYFQEQIIHDYIKQNPDMSIAILRYFNPVGAHPSGLIGEDPNGVPNNLFPYLLKIVSSNMNKKNIYLPPQYLQIFGNNYNTKDGTCVRDFIHVMDLAEAHTCVLEKINIGIDTYNVGTGEGFSVLELVKAFEKVNDVTILYKIVERRQGDVDILYADSSKIYNELGWKSKYTIYDICRDGYHFLLEKEKIKN